MGRRFQLWQKKRGHRRTGSRLAASVGEGLLFACLLLLGSFALMALVTSRMIDIPGVSTLTTGSGLWLSVIVLASLILIGGGGLLWTLLHLGTSAERRRAIASRAAELELLTQGLPRSGDYPTIPRSEPLIDSPGVHLRYRLPSSTAPTWSLLALAVFCLMWNGLLAAVAAVFVKGVVAGKPPWLTLLLLLPMLAVAVRVTWRFLRQLRHELRVGNTSVEVSDLPLYPGQRYDICVVHGGRMPWKILKLLLACDESATFREGTDIRIETRRVWLQKILQFTPMELGRPSTAVHQGEMIVPSDIMHSFQSSNNAVQWKILVQGELAEGEEFERSFPVVVFPPVMDADELAS